MSLNKWKVWPVENSEDVLKIDQKKISHLFIPHFVGVGKFYFGQKLVTRSSFSGHKLFVNF